MAAEMFTWCIDNTRELEDSRGKVVVIWRSYTKENRNKIMVLLPHSSCTMQCCSTGLLLARMTWKDMWGCHLKKPDADGDCCNCVHCDSLGSIVSASQMAAGKVLGKGQIPTASSQSTYYFPSCILLFFLFILVFFFPSNVKYKTSRYFRSHMAPLRKLYLLFSTSVTEGYKYSINPTTAFL